MPPQLVILNRSASLPAPGQKRSALYLMQLRAEVGRKQGLKRGLRASEPSKGLSEVRPLANKRVRN